MKLIDKIAKTKFKELFKKMNYSYFEKGSYNLNIIGVRSKERINNNTFDDYIIVEYKDSYGKWIRNVFPATTNPGVYWLTNPCSSAGCAILVPGQWRQCWTIGLHKNKYKALVQCKPIKVYRDNNKDKNLDYNVKIQEGIFGINIHKAGIDSKYVDNWSAGCQVFKKLSDFNAFMKLCEIQKNTGLGDKFTYTLIDEKDLELVGLY